MAQAAITVYKLYGRWSEVSSTVPRVQRPHTAEGKGPNGADWTKLACAYWPAWADAVAARWYPTMRNHRRKAGWEGAAPILMTPENATQMDALAVSNFTPSGGRTLTRAAETMATGMQPTRKALPQLVPDGLTPHLHLQVAVVVRHPMSLKPSATAPVEYVLKYAEYDPEDAKKKTVDGEHFEGIGGGLH